MTKTSTVIRKCENCGIETPKPATGWTGGIGLGENRRSKYGKQYDRRAGWAWWCQSPVCQRVKNRLCLRTGLPSATDEELDALIDEAEMEKIREN